MQSSPPTRPDGKTRRELLRSTFFGGKSFGISVAVGLATAISSWLVDWVPVAASTLFGLAALSMTVAGIVYGLSTVLISAHESSQYGRILRAIDPELEALRLPYVVVTAAAVSTALALVGAGLALPTLTASWSEALVFGVLAALGSYTSAGLIEVLVIDHRHRGRASRMLSSQERVEAATRRAAKGKRAQGPVGPA